MPYEDPRRHDLEHRSDCQPVVLGLLLVWDLSRRGLVRGGIAGEDDPIAVRSVAGSIARECRASYFRRDLALAAESDVDALPARNFGASGPWTW